MLRRVLPLAVVLVVGCMETPKPDPIVRETSLYQRIGGQAKLEKVADDTIVKLILDDRLLVERKRKLLGKQGEQLRSLLVVYLGEVTGGPQQADENLIDECERLGMDAGDILALEGALEQTVTEAEVAEADRTKWIAKLSEREWRKEIDRRDEKDRPPGP